MSIVKFLPSEAKCQSLVRKQVFPSGLRCPHCGFRQIYKHENRYRCKHCRKPFSLKSASWLKGMRFSYQTLWLLIHCWIKRIPVDQTAGFTGLSIPTVRKWFSKFRARLPAQDWLRLEKNVVIDEMYRGGKKNGYSVVGAKQKGTKNIALALIKKPSVDRRDAVTFLENNVKPNSNLFSDGSAIYKGIANWWPVNHRYEVHNKGQFALTAEIEGLWGNFTTFVRRMYHHVTLKKIDELLSEFFHRFSHPEMFESPNKFIEISFKSVPFAF